MFSAKDSPFRFFACAAVIVFAACTLWSCSVQQPKAKKPPESELDRDTSQSSWYVLPKNAAADYGTVRVYFATDRDRGSRAISPAKFGAGRGSPSYGYCDVSIPNDHRMGQLESPTWWKFEFSSNPSKHVSILASAVQDSGDFYRDLSNKMRQSDGGNALIFVHGYNVTFDDAARRTAQLAYDLAFDGPSVFYSWPSSGELTPYMVDEQNIEWAQTDLTSFLNDFVRRADAKNIYIIAHSMGTRALARAISAVMSQNSSAKAQVREIILAAPDIDADVFRRDIAPALTAARRPVTLYASSYDVALQASETLHHYPRAGDSGKGLVIYSGVETIDATAVSTGFLGHSYFAEDAAIEADIYTIIHDARRANERAHLDPIDTTTGRYWAFARQGR